MMRINRLFVLGIAASLALTTTLLAKEAPLDKPPTTVRNNTETVVAGNNQFALELFARLQTADKNTFISPYSISTALAMTYVGARGDTAKQMADVLHFEQEQESLHAAFAELNNRIITAKKDYQISVANALWGQKGEPFLESFLGITRKHYGAEQQVVDFVKATEEARKTINTWVEKQTQDKIKELIRKGILDELTVLVLTNAIYFKGNWATRFTKDLTKDEPFMLSGDKNITVPMMQMDKKLRLNYLETEDFQCLELPYQGEEISMAIFLPKKVDGISDLAKAFTINNLEQWLKGLREKDVKVGIPKFKITYDCELNEILPAMGMTDAFSRSADFSGINGKKDLFISNVIHKAFVDVNEEGTEAAAATAVVIKRSNGSRPKIFRADHPFIFLIRDMRSGSILFIGTVMNPNG